MAQGACAGVAGAWISAGTATFSLDATQVRPCGYKLRTLLEIHLSNQKDHPHH